MKTRKSAERSPLSEFALTLDDVQPGTPYVQYNLAFGVVSSGEFTDKQAAKGWIVTTARSEPWSLADMGIIPYGSDHWNRINLTIRPQHLEHMPTPDPRLAPDDQDMYED